MSKFDLRFISAGAADGAEAAVDVEGGKVFKLKDGEPTKTYLKMSRVGGAVISAASFVAMVVSFF